MMYLEIKNVTKVIDQVKVLDCVTLSMDKGKIYGLRGKNGSGKTMLMKAICGLIRITEGEIWVDGELLGTKYDFPKSVGALIETPGFVEHYNGYNNLKLLADIKGVVGREEIEEMMNRVGLSSKEKKKVKQYSLGMRQKLGIVAALMEHPDLIILDEPTNALDEESVNILYELLQEEKKRGALILIASHDGEELEQLCDEIYVVNAGKVKQYQETKEKAFGGDRNEEEKNNDIH